MKKIITIVCVAALMLSLGVAAYAASNPQTSQADTSQAEQLPADSLRENGEKPSAPPDRIDLDEMVSKGVISQETCDKIKAFMEEHKPTDLPDMSGQPPQMDDQAPDMSDQFPQMNEAAPMGIGLLNDLLNNGIITQAEYDALSAEIAK